jgi:hypothetical protein
MDLVFDCGECDYRNCKKLVLGETEALYEHYMGQHGYSIDDCKKLIQWYIDETPQTGDGEILNECTYHGEYIDVCYGCEAADHALDEWKERRYSNEA